MAERLLFTCAQMRHFSHIDNFFIGALPVGLTTGMRAALYKRTGTALDVLELVDCEVPVPGQGEVLVKLAFSGINPTDVKSRGGNVAMSFTDFQVPHHDGAGVIDAVGEGVDPNRIGERVWVMLAVKGNRFGTAAEFCLVASEFARTLPNSISLELAATLGVPAVTAAYCLFGDGPITGQSILVSGGAGAVGRAAVQLATWGGARVLTTVSSQSKAQVARDAGAEFVVNYKDPGAVDQLKGRGISRIVEVNLADNLELDLAISLPGMKIVSYAADGDDPVIPRRALMTACITIEFMLLYNVMNEKFWAAVQHVEQALSDGALTMPPVSYFPLDEIVAAHESVEAGSSERVLIRI
jgi:NADPH2:quinone reductase